MMSFAFFLEVLLRESVSKLEMPWKLDLLSEGDPLQVFSIHLIPWHLLFDCGNKNINSLIFRAMNEISFGGGGMNNIFLKPHFALMVSCGES